MRAHSMTAQLNSESRKLNFQQYHGQRITSDQKNHNNLNNKNQLSGKNQDNQYLISQINGGIGQDINIFKHKSAQNKRANQQLPLNKLISNNKAFALAEYPQLSGSFTPVLLDQNKKLIQQQQQYIEMMQNNSNRNKVQNNQKILPTGTFYSKQQNQMPQSFLKKQQTAEESYQYQRSDIQMNINEVKNGNRNQLNEMNMSDWNFNKLKVAIQFDNQDKQNSYLADTNGFKKSQLNSQNKQYELSPSQMYLEQNSEYQDIQIPSNRISINGPFNPYKNEEDETIYNQFRQIAYTQNEGIQSNQYDGKVDNQKNFTRQISYDTSEDRVINGLKQQALQYLNHQQNNQIVQNENTQLDNSKVKGQYKSIVNNMSSSYSRQLNSPPPQNIFVSPYKQGETFGSNSEIPSSVITTEQSSGIKNSIARRSYSAVKGNLILKKDDIQNRIKKGNPNDLMILKIKEQCTNKKYNDPIGIKKQKAKQKMQSETKQYTKMNSTTYEPKQKEDTLRKRSKKYSMATDDNNNYEGGREEDNDDDDSLIMSNDVSLDLDDEDDTKPTSSYPIGDLATSQKSRVLLLKSVYQGRPSTIFFPYHKSCQQPTPRDTTRTIAISEFEIKKFNLKFKINGENPYKCVVKAFEEAGIEMTDEGDWNLVWSLPKRDRVKRMNQFQKQNHFPGCWNLGRKDFLWRSLNRVKRKYPKEMDFVPNTYLLCNSGDWDRFLARRDEASKNTLWILKPADQACGRGVKVISKTSKVKRKSNRIICDYIANPHLINGLKYDLRLYVLVTSYDPLRIYLYEEGLTRFATEKYTTNTKEVSKRYVHLTNYSVNKHAKKFVKNTNFQNDGEGSKWSLTALKAKYQQMGINVDELFGRIKDVIIKTCISAEPQMLDIVAKSQEHRTNCFELYGFDVLIDSNLKPWILEVNVCPSLSSSSPLDRKIKHSLLVDVLNIVGLMPYDKKSFSEDKKNNLFTRAFTSTTSTILDSDFDKVNQQVKKNFSKNLNDIQDLNAENCLEKLSPENWEVLFETDEEYYRRGHFERIYPIPSKERLDYYSQFFEFQRFNNIIIQKWILSNTNYLEKILKKRYQTVV